MQSCDAEIEVEVAEYMCCWDALNRTSRNFRNVVHSSVSTMILKWQIKKDVAANKVDKKFKSELLQNWLAENF